MNFGHDGPYQFKEVGINGKNSEFHAAMGLCNLNYVGKCLQKRKELTEYYDQNMYDVPVTRPVIRSGTSYNYAYYPVVFESGQIRRKVVHHLSEHSIETRRYFCPSLETLNYMPDADVPISNSISERVLCLPFFYDLTCEDIDLVVDEIKNAMR